MKVLYYQKYIFNYQKVKLIQKKKFVVIVLKLKYKAFIVHIIVFNISFNIDDKVYFSKKAQIAYLKVNKALIESLVSMLIS